MKKLVLAALLASGTLFSAAIGLDFRPSFAYEIFSSPYYRILKKDAPVANAKIGFVPVTLDARAQVNPTFLDARMPALLQAFNHYMADSLKLNPLSLPVYSVPPTQNNLPDIFLGSILQGQRPLYVTIDCAQAQESPEYCLRLAGQLGSKAWMEQLRNAMAANNLDYALILQVGEGYIYPNGKMKKVNPILETRHAPPAGLDMGTDFWLPMSQKLVATNKPIDVLFVKGLLVNKEGKIMRAGGEGITAASKAHFLEQVVNISHEFSEDELNSVENEIRRDDLPHAPLNWQVATRQLVGTLTNSNLKTARGYVQQ
jgi:hypothetical protein